MLLDIDLGELPDEPEALYACAHLANVACGGHAGDDASMRRAVAMCLKHGTRIGAHPSYPDREGFGRRTMSMDPTALWACIATQCKSLRTIAAESGATVRYVKAHGALYHDAQRSHAVAEALVKGARAGLGPFVRVLGPPSGALATQVHRTMNFEYLREGFADRAARPDGTLVPRDEPGALITDPAEAARQAVALARFGGVGAICCHGDTPGAVAIARAVRDALDALAAHRERTP